MATKAKKWLSLQEAADQLGVHFTTIRRWVDDGAIPTMLTPGGHRRFLPDDLEAFAQTHRKQYIKEGLEDLWEQSALKYTRQELDTQPREAWMSRFDPKNAAKHRELGQRLMGVMMQYISKNEEDLALIEEAESIGRIYAQEGKNMDAPLSHVLEALFFFKDRLVDATLQMPETVQMRPQTNAKLLRRMNHILNAVQLAIAKGYE
jgi:excisionase family DNA binding protein